LGLRRVKSAPLIKIKIRIKIKKKKKKRGV